MNPALSAHIWVVRLYRVADWPSASCHARCWQQADHFCRELLYQVWQNSGTRSPHKAMFTNTSGYFSLPDVKLRAAGVVQGNGGEEKRSASRYGRFTPGTVLPANTGQGAAWSPQPVANTLISTPAVNCNSNSSAVQPRVRARTRRRLKITLPNTDQAHEKYLWATTSNFSQAQLSTPWWWIAHDPKHVGVILM